MIDPAIELDECWYDDKIGKYVYFFDKIFKDDMDKKQSLWKATVPTKYYAHLEDTNYIAYLRKLKLKKISKSEKIKSR